MSLRLITASFPVGPDVRRQPSRWSIMEVGTAPEDLVRTMVAEDHRPAGAIHIVKERHAGKDAAYAVAFEDRDGVERRGIIGLRRLEGGGWSPSGSFMGSVR